MRDIDFSLIFCCCIFNERNNSFKFICIAHGECIYATRISQTLAGISHVSVSVWAMLSNRISMQPTRFGITIINKLKKYAKWCIHIHNFDLHFGIHQIR